MIGKILHGSEFAGLVDYVNDPRKGAKLVAASEGINLTSNQSIIDSFVIHAGLSARAKKPVAHCMLSLSPHDAAQLTEKKLERIVQEYLRRMGYSNNKFVAFRHHDKEHPHVHIIVNRVNNQGRCTKDSHEKDRNVKVCHDLTHEFGLYMARGKEKIKEKRLRSMDAIRHEMMHCVRESLQVTDNWKDFQEDLAKVGIHFQFRFNHNTSAIEGISFTIAKDMVKGQNINSRMRHDISFSGKQLDPSLTLARLCEKLGNPVAIIHTQAKDMYEDAREDWYKSHTPRECQNIDDIFPDFDFVFPWHAKAQIKEAPDMDGSGESIPDSFIEELHNGAEDVTNAGNNSIYVGIQTLAKLLFLPYQPSVSAEGGGGSSSQIGWREEDKYKKRHLNAQSRSKRGGYHR